MPATATKSRKGKKAALAARFRNAGYDAIRSIADKPYDQRREVPAGRHGEMVVPRKFHLSDKQIEELKADLKENGGSNKNYVPNPHNKTFYYYLVESLKSLGVNRPHGVPVVINKFRELANASETKDEDGRTFWSRWKNKDAATNDDKKALPWEGKFEQNAEVLQRVPLPGSRNKHPYGLKLLEVGTHVLETKGVVIDIIKSARGEKQFMLNTNSAIPRNDFKTRGVAAQASAPAKKSSKPRKATASTSEAAAVQETATAGAAA